MGLDLKKKHSYFPNFEFNMKILLKKMAASLGLWMAFDYYDRGRKLKLMNQQVARTISDFPLDSKKTSHRIFILGSGYSINSISAENWKIIKANDSFGFNTWMFHSHVPTYYAWETPSIREYFDAMVKRFNDRSSEYKEIPLFVQFQHAFKMGYSMEELRYPTDNIYYFAPYTFHTTNKKLLKKAIARFLDQKEPDLGKIIHYGGSLSNVIMMSYLMGYKEIVLMGIDLNDPRYWFMKDDVDAPTKAFAEIHCRWSQKTGRSKDGGKHATVDKKFTSLYGSLPIDEYLKILKEELNKRGVRLFIGNEKSQLYTMLPLYKF